MVSPVDTPNKVFNKSAKKTAQKKACILFMFNSIFTILSLLIHWNKGLIFIDLSLVICATGLYTGYISNIRRPSNYFALTINFRLYRAASDFAINSAICILKNETLACRHETL